MTLNRCTGSGFCPAPLHVHGCYADHDGSACDDPEDHNTSVQPDAMNESSIHRAYLGEDQ